MGIKIWNKTALTGGTELSLDGISVADLEDGHRAWIEYNNSLYFYGYDATATAAESSPDVIRPDDYTTQGNWELMAIAPMGLTAPSGVMYTGDIYGFDCSADTDTDHDVSVAAGACEDSGGDTVFTHTAAMVKQIDAAWSVGNNAGGMLTGSVAANALYDFYALYKTSDGSIDFGWLPRGTDITANYPTGYSKHRWLRYYLTDASSNLCSTTQSGDYISHDKASDWVVSSGITTSYATVDHTSFIPTDRVDMIKYGVRDTVTGSAHILASDDGANVAFDAGTTYVTATDTNGDAWGYGSQQGGGLHTFNASREFKSTTGTVDLLIHMTKMRR